MANEKEAPAKPKPIRIDVGPEIHVYKGKRYGPGVVTLKPEDFTNTDSGEVDESGMTATKNNLIQSVRRTHESNNKRLGIVAKELGDQNANAANLRPPPIHQTLPDNSGEPENLGSPPATQTWSENREHDPNEQLPPDQQ